MAININTSDAEELKQASGISDDQAEAIISYREENGEFESVEDLKKVPGVSDETMKRLAEGDIEL